MGKVMDSSFPCLQKLNNTLLPSSHEPLQLHLTKDILRKHYWTQTSAWRIQKDGGTTRNYEKTPFGIITGATAEVSRHLDTRVDTQSACHKSAAQYIHSWNKITVSFHVRVINLFPSDEEDDVIGHHDLVVVLHASQSGSNLWLCEAGLTPLVDVVHQGLHLHGLSVSSLEHCEQWRLEFLEPGGGNRQIIFTQCTLCSCWWAPIVEKPSIIQNWLLEVLTIWSSLKLSPTSLQIAHRLQPVMWHPWPPPPALAWLVSGCQLELFIKKEKRA